MSGIPERVGITMGQRVIRAAIGLLVPLAITAVLMVLAPAGIYLWLKALHLASAVTWMAGMLGLIYLLSWHVNLPRDVEAAEVLVQAENWLLRAIVNPAMVLAWGIGLWLGWDAGWFASAWLQVKLVLVLALSGLHGWVVAAIRKVATGALKQPPRTLHNITGIGAAITLGVVILAVVKPM